MVAVFSREGTKGPVVSEAVSGVGVERRKDGFGS